MTKRVSRERALAAYIDGLVYEARKPHTFAMAHTRALQNMQFDTQPTEAALGAARTIITALDALDALRSD